jgi:anti-sigma factor RsiW
LNLRRTFDRHIDSQELNALAPSSAETGRELPQLSPDAIREAERHVDLCVECSRKVSKYQQLVNRFPSVKAPEAVPPGTGCPNDDDVDWHEVAAGLWPELKAKQLIMHAALCDHCGPLLRAATTLDNDPTPEEEKWLAELKMPSQPDLMPPPVAPPPSTWRLLRWLIPAAALMVIAGVLSTISSWPSTALSGPKYAEFAVETHKQHVQGRLALDVHSDSQQALNEWLKAKSSFPLSLPGSPAIPGEERPYHLEGASMVNVGGKTAAFIAYRVPTAQKQADAVSLIVAPDSVAVASGGVEVDYTKVRFHYSMVDGYKVVTWSLHGLTYALVSQEGNNTQRSCMVCHSAMRDRDLSQTPTPLRQQSSGTILN